MLPKAHLTLQCRMSGSRWVITPWWLSGMWRFFLYHFSVYSYHLFLISSASVRSLQFMSFIEPTFAWNVPLISLIFWRDLQSFPFYCFPPFLCIYSWGRLSYLFLLLFGTLLSNGCIFPLVLGFSFPVFSQLFVRLPQTAILLFCISFSCRCSWFLCLAPCHKPPFIVHQTLYHI